MGDSETIFDSDSSRGSHHPSRECFMVGTPKGRVESVHEGGATPPNDLDDEVEEDAGALPRMWVEQLRVRHQGTFLACGARNTRGSLGPSQDPNAARACGGAASGELAVSAMRA